MYKQQIDENKKIIRRQDKMIVDLQQKNELSQNEVANTQDQVSIQINKKDKLELRLRELNDQRQAFVGQIAKTETQIGEYKTMIDTRNYNMSYAQVPEETGTEQKQRGRRSMQKNFDQQS